MLRSDAAFKLYLTALMKNGMEASINAAVRRRDSLLASPATSTSEHSMETSTTEISSSDPATASPESIVTKPSANPSSTASPTASQNIAQSVLSASGTAQAQHTGPLSSDMSKLAAALGGSAGNASNPIVVTLAERWSYFPLSHFLVLTFCYSKRLVGISCHQIRDLHGNVHVL